MTQFNTNATNIGCSIEEKIRKARAQGLDSEQTMPMIYTDAKDGVLPQHDIRTDRQELALEAIDHYQASDIAKRDNLNIDIDNDLPEYVEQQTKEE